MCVYYQNIKMSTYFESIFNYYLTQIVQCHNKFYKIIIIIIIWWLHHHCQLRTQLLKKKIDLFFYQKRQTHTHTQN